MSKARRALLDLVSGKQVDIEILVSRKFSDDFELVCRHYNLIQLGEYAEAKKAARADLDNAIATFAALADEIRN